ncbi:MAG TPA: PQQ-dependent sugar dehydrogenase [Lacipirellulaceae bacterium]|nr:PQQ-dependent sugar dehydrogenase [Lacipirellulaceae bacterium]
MSIQWRRWACLAIGLACARPGHAQQYRVERIAAGLNQPSYVAQAPGDPAHVLYYTERTSDTQGGFSVANDMGKVWRYDVDARTRSLVLDLSSREVFQDTGLQTIAFSPDFNVEGSYGYQKFYISSAERGSSALNRVEEYLVGPGGAATFSKLVLQYQNNRENNHTVNWVGFDPTAAGAARTYLYISTGDGSFGNSYSSGTSTSGRPSQNPSDVAGKFLRVDVSGPDAYPADALKNFAIPPSNPVPAYNAANPGAPLMGTIRTGGVVSPAPALGEVWLTGVRNGYRAGFDRATGDFWFGDVGENAREEINFIKAGSNAGAPVDLGWPQLEAMNNSNVMGAPHTTTNPFTGVTSLNPIHAYPRTVGQAVMGGTVYRGPIQELAGRYLFADFAGTGKTFTATFDRSTPAATFNGANAAVTDVSSAWQALVVDAGVPGYGPSTSGTDLPGLDHIVAISEDNAGNAYLVDFGNRSGAQSNFDGQYPAAGLGEIFRLTRTLDVKLVVDRDSGTLTLVNETGAPLGLRGYAAASLAGGLAAQHLTPIAGRLDEAPQGDGSFDPDDAWSTSSVAGSSTLLREASAGDGGVLAPGGALQLGAADAWIPSLYEDLSLHVTLADGSLALGEVEFVGNGGQGFARSDLNGSGDIDLGDWSEFLQGHLADLSAMTLVQQYRRGDLDGDGSNTFDDFRLFQADYDAVHGPGALAQALAAVPEPSSAALLLAVAFLLGGRRGTRLASRR